MNTLQAKRFSFDSPDQALQLRRSRSKNWRSSLFLAAPADGGSRTAFGIFGMESGSGDKWGKEQTGEKAGLFRLDYLEAKASPLFPMSTETVGSRVRARDDHSVLLERRLNYFRCYLILKELAGGLSERQRRHLDLLQAIFEARIAKRAALAFSAVPDMVNPEDDLADLQRFAEES